MRPTLRPAAAAAHQPHEHGQYIYAYCHVRTNQVLYSLKRTLDGHHSLKQLPDTGANTPQASNRLRRDLWRPFFFVTFPPTPSTRLSPRGPGSNAQGLNAYRKLREWRKLHEHHWTPPASLSRPYTEEQKKELKKRYDDRGGSKKESVYDIIKREKKKVRLGEVWDQKANSVADLAAVLKEQEGVGGTMEEGKESRRRREVREMLRLSKEAEGGGVDRIEEQIEQLAPFLERREGWRVEDGAEISQRKARRREFELMAKKARMEFARRAVEGVREMVLGFERIEREVERGIRRGEGVDDARAASENERTVGGNAEPANTEKSKTSLKREKNRQKSEAGEKSKEVPDLRSMVLEAVREAKVEILKDGEVGVKTVKAWIADAREKIESAATEESVAAKYGQKDGSVSEGVEGEVTDFERRVLRERLKVYEMVLTEVEAFGRAYAERRQSKAAGMKGLEQQERKMEELRDAEAAAQLQDEESTTQQREQQQDAEAGTQSQDAEATTHQQDPEPPPQPKFHGPIPIPHLPSFPPEPTPSDPSILAKRARLRTERKVRRQNAPVFTMQGVKVRFSNILDAEFAEDWPSDVVVEPMGLTGMSAPKADEEPIHGVVEWMQRRQMAGQERKRLPVLRGLVGRVVEAVLREGRKGKKGRELVGAEEEEDEKGLLVKEEDALIVEEEKRPVVVSRTG